MLLEGLEVHGHARVCAVLACAPVAFFRANYYRDDIEAEVISVLQTRNIFHLITKYKHQLKTANTDRKAYILISLSAELYIILY